MIQVLVNNETPRVKYALSLVFRQVLHTEFEIITNLDQVNGFCINYSGNPAEGLLKIWPHPILNEDEIPAYNPVVSSWNELPVFFCSPDGFDIPFDVFAASFWVTTRYEEYSTSETDFMGRYKASASHAARNGYLKKPVVNLWAAELKKLILQKDSSVVFGEMDYRFVPTIDVDSMYKYKYKGFVRNTGGFFRDLFTGRFSNCSERLNVLLNRKRDPWDCLGEIEKIHIENGMLPMYFILAAKRSKYDKNIPANSSQFAKNVLALQHNCRLGIHPSFAGHCDENAWKNEKKTLEGILRTPVYEARVHFLKLTFPDTYQKLLELGIQFDFTMGYPETTGFRAGICSPFFFFDLTENRETELCVVPLGMMDVTLSKYMKMNNEEAKIAVAEIVKEIRQVEGVFVSLWHNESFGEDVDNAHTENLYRYLLKVAK